MAGTAKFQNANNGSVLAAGVGALDSSLGVVDPTKFSSDGYFDILIDAEYIGVPVGGVVGSTFGGILRGLYGSGAVSHSSGATVTQIITDGQAFQLWPNLVFTATVNNTYTASPQEFVSCDSSGGVFTVTLPLAFIAGANCPVVVCDLMSGAGVNVVPQGGDTLFTSWGGFLQQQTVIFISDGFDDWRPFGGTGRISAFPDLSPPGTTITAPYVLLASDVWKEFDAGSGPYAISAQNAVPGRLIRLQHNNQTILEGAGVTLSRGTNLTFSLEDPVSRAITTSPVPLEISGACYEYMLDSTNHILRCMRTVR